MQKFTVSEDIKARLKTPQVRNVLFILVKLLITALLISYFKDRFEGTDFWRVLISAHPGYVIASIGASAIGIGLQIAKWRRFSEKCFDRHSVRDAVFSYFQGMAVGIISPMRAGEVVGRKLHYTDVPLKDITLTTVTDKAQNYMVNVLAGSLAAILYLLYHVAVSSMWFYIIIAVVVVWYMMFISLLLIPSMWKLFVKSVFGRLKIFRKVIAYVEPLRSIDRATLRYTFGCAIASYAMLMLQYSFLLSAYDGRISFTNGVQIGSLTIFSKTIIPSITFIDFGIRELSSMYFSKNFGFAESTGFNAAFIVFISNLVVPSIIGMISFFMRKYHAPKAI